uniref:Uncharacterized protein n=1 Tax=Romanomermis culicivorax TaxID=13658 RepID=A0A915HFI9_ROMCU
MDRSTTTHDGQGVAKNVHVACGKDAELDLIIRYKTAGIKMATMMSKPVDKKGEEMEKNKLGQRQNEKKKKKTKKKKEERKRQRRIGVGN